VTTNDMSRMNVIVIVIFFISCNVRENKTIFDGEILKGKVKWIRCGNNQFAVFDGNGNTIYKRYIVRSNVDTIKSEESNFNRVLSCNDNLFLYEDIMDYDVQNNLIEVTGTRMGGKKTIYKYNKSNKVILSENYDNNDSLLYAEHYSYDKGSEYDSIEINHAKKLHKYHRFDSKQHEVESITFNISGKDTLSEILITYNEIDSIASESNINFQSKENNTRIYKYDNKGHQVEEMEYTNNSLIAKSIFKYDNNDNLIFTSVFDYSNNGNFNVSKISYERKYNTQNQLIEIKSLTTSENLCRTIIESYTDYDREGNYLKCKIYIEDIKDNHIINRQANLIEREIAYY